MPTRPEIQILLFSALAACCLHLPARAANDTPFERQSPALLSRAVEGLLKAETAGLPGTVSFEIGALDPRSALPACLAPQAFVPPGARLWGKSTVGVRCGDPQWSVNVPVTVRVSGSYYMTLHPLRLGQVVAAEDLAVRTGDLTELPAGIVTDPAQAVGKTTALGLSAGLPLRADMLRSPLAVLQGQTVRLVTIGQGFKVSAEGRAVQNATAGQLARVQTPSGQVVSGIARENSVVEVSY